MNDAECINNLLMTKEEALNDFLKNLRIAISNSSAYTRDHPYYIKSIGSFKEKVDALFSFLDPISIGITTNSLYLDGKYWDKLALYTELAQSLHMRKIKAIEFKAGVTVEELVAFLTSISLPIREIFRSGGLQNILGKERILHIAVEQLDYSQLLTDGDHDYKDIWLFLISDALKKKDSARINYLTENFEKVIDKFKLNDLVGDPELKQALTEFLSYLSNYQQDKFSQCSSKLMSSFLKYKNAFQESDVEKIKALFKDMDGQKLTDMLLREVELDDNFDPLTLSLFTRLIGEDKNKDLASVLGSRLKDENFRAANPKILNKIKGLFSASADNNISQVYKNTLTAIFSEIIIEEGLVFDRMSLARNFRFILISMLNIENGPERLTVISQRVLKESEAAAKEKDFNFLKLVLDVSRKRKSEVLEVFDNLNKVITGSIENLVWDQGARRGIEKLVDFLEESSLGPKLYLDRIFSGDKINPLAIKLFFKFYPQELFGFNKRLGERHVDFEFLTSIVRVLSGLNSQLAGEALKYIYGFANPVLKIEVLKSMRNLPKLDENFLFPIATKGDPNLKKEALIILQTSHKFDQDIFKALFFIPSPLGIKNSIILENLRIAEEIEMKEAAASLAQLAKRRLFWNRALRDKARIILKKWGL